MAQKLIVKTATLFGVVVLIYFTKFKGVIGMVIVMALAIVAFYFKQNKLLYRPIAKGVPRSPSQNSPGLRNPQQFKIPSWSNVELTTSDGVKIRGWHIRAQRSERVIIYFHGNSGNIGTRLEFVKGLMETTNSDVILVAYRGYSDSEGEPSEQGLKKDSEAVLEYANRYGKENKLGVYIYGRSLGGAVAIHASTSPAHCQHIKGVIIENTFTSIKDLVDVLIPIIKYMRWIQRNHWRSIDFIGKIKQPILFIKSMQDELIPPSQMHELQRNAQQAPFVEEYRIETGNHSSSWRQDTPAYYRRVHEFLKRVQT